MPYPSRLLSCCLAGCLAAAAGDAQDPSPSSEAAEAFVETVDVRVVNVEVFVTDRDGQPVRGLALEDFEIREDGNRVEVTNFYAVEGGAVRNDVDPPAPLPEVPPDPRLEGPQRTVVPEDQRLHLILYVDNFNIQPFNRNRVLAAVRTFLRQHLGPDDQVMLMSYDRTLKLRHPFTSNKELVASALYELEEVTGLAVQAEADRREILQAIFDENRSFDARGRVNAYADSLYNDLIFTLRSLKSFVESLAGLPGRKAILYVSDGLPMRPGEDAFHALQEVDRNGGSLLESFRYDATRRFQEVVNQANAHRVTFYAIDAAGLRSYSLMNAETGHLGAQSTARYDQIHFSNLQGSLRYMADETGGLAIVNTNGFTAALERVAADFDSYYSLGYRPPDRDAGRLHRLEVRIPGRKGLRIRHRTAYRDRPVDLRMADTTLAALHFGYQQNPMGLRLEFARAQPHESGHYVVPVVIKIPMADLSFFLRGEVQRSQLKVYIAARDSEGGLAPVQDVPLTIEIPQAELERARSHDYEFQVPLMLREGSQLVAVGVRDELGSLTSFVTRGLRIGA